MVVAVGLSLPKLTRHSGRHLFLSKGGQFLCLNPKPPLLRFHVRLGDKKWGYGYSRLSCWNGSSKPAVESGIP